MVKKTKQYEFMIMGYGVLSIFAGVITLLSNHYFFSKNPSSSNKVYNLTNSIAIACILIGIYLVIIYIRTSRRRKKELLESIERDEAERELARNLASNQAEITAEEFLSLRAPQEFTGVYILHNEDKDMYYVGQSVRVMQRVRQHLTGHGNGDVYADFKYGDRFTVRTISMVSSGYLSIDELEMDMIDAYDAMDSGYNRTRGNRT